MNSRIKIEKEEKQLIITINAFKDEGKQKVLLMWIVMFSLCGIAIFSQFFADYDNKTKIFFGVYIAFWLFFEFKVIYAYRWRKYGLEKIIVEKGELYLIKEIKKRGITQRFKINEINTLRLINDEDSEFVKSMTKSYWSINKYALGFNHKDYPVFFGIDLDLKTSKQILKELQQVLN